MRWPYLVPSSDVAVTSTPAASSSSIVGWRSCRAAQCNGVHSAPTVRVSGSPRQRSNAATISVLPCVAARCSDVLPYK